MTDLLAELTEVIAWINGECGVNERIMLHKTSCSTMFEIRATASSSTRFAVVSKVAGCSKFVVSGFLSYGKRPSIQWLESFLTKEVMVEVVHDWVIDNKHPNKGK